MEDNYKNIRPEMRAKEYKLDPEYEYCEIEIWTVHKELLLSAVKEMEEGTLDPQSPRAQSVIEFIDYLEKFLPSQGYEVYEIVHVAQAKEIRRLRRKKQQ